MVENSSDKSDKDSETQSSSLIAKNEIVEQELFHSYSLRPKISQKFRSSDVKELLHSVLLTRLADKDYNVDTCTELSRSICSEIKEKLKTLNYDRYKFVVQCVIGEQKGAGVNMSGRCFWDSDTDNFAESIYMNKTLFCAVAAYGVYYY